MLQGRVTNAMPIYEYEPEDRECFICEGKLEILQSITADPLSLCPYCGMEICKKVSRASFKMGKPEISKGVGAEKAAEKGFTTYKKSQQGVWEKVGGEGADYMVGASEDVKAVESEKQKPAKVLDLDKTE
jgi:putative FmdB family regulatory protein